MSRLNERELILAVLRAENGRVRGAKFSQAARRIDPTFAPAGLGFPTLRAFLEAHSDVVCITHDGFDLVAEARTEDAHGLADTTEVDRIRSDIWGAFTFVDESLLRYFDRQTARGGR